MYGLLQQRIKHKWSRVTNSRTSANVQMLEIKTLSQEGLTYQHYQHSVLEMNRKQQQTQFCPHCKGDSLPHWLCWKSQLINNLWKTQTIINI